MTYVLGIDLGTSSLKGVLVNQAGEIVATTSSDYPLIHHQIGYAEQEPNEWIKACEQMIQQLLQEVPNMKSLLRGISFSGQMHSLVLLNGRKEVLRPAILWNDVRTTKQCETLMEKHGEELLAITKNIALEGFTLPKILWVKEHEPYIWNEVHHILLPKDYLGFWMTGNMHMDYSDAAGTLMLDMNNNEWSEEILQNQGIPSNYLPKLTSSSNKIGYLNKGLLEKFDIQHEVEVYAGGADNACAAIGAGITNSDIGLASIGTSGVFLSYDGKVQPSYEGKLHFFNHAIKDSYYSMGVTLAAGHSLSWFKDNFAKDITYEELLCNINEIPLGSNGLIFTPYIVGERTPYIDSQVRGSFIGIDTNHTLSHFARAVLEGVTFSLKDSQVLMEQVANKHFKKIVSVGGGAKNNDWLQMQADIFDVEVVSLKTEQGPGMGAAMIAAVGMKWFDTIEDCAKEFVSYNEPIIPIEENVRKYKKIYDIYKTIYKQTRDISHQLRTLK